MKDQASWRILCGSRKFCQRGSAFDNVFFLSWWAERWSKYHNKRTNIGVPAKRHLNGVSLSYRRWPNIECWLGNLVFFQGKWTSIARKPYSFMIFQGGGCRPLYPLWLHPCAYPHSCQNLNCLFQVRKLSIPSLKECILASYIVYRSSNKTQFCSMVIHVHHKSVHSEDSDELAHMRSLARAFIIYCLYTI